MLIKVYCYLFIFFVLHTLKAFETKEGCPAVLCAIYQEVARKIGIVCEAVYCNQNDREDENSLSDFMMNHPKLLLRWKDSAG
jgi:F-box protein 21